MLILCGIIFFAFLNICIYEINFFIHLHFDFKSIRFANEELHERFFVFFFLQLEFDLATQRLF